MKKISEYIETLFPNDPSLFDYIKEKMDELKTTLPKEEKRLFNENENLLITYADQVYGEEATPLSYLNRFVSETLQNKVSHVHLLPFYPWSSDDGFSPIDYQQVDHKSGSWEDVEGMKQIKMFDCVFNHISSKCEFFQRALKGESEFEEMFHVYSEDEYNDPDFQEQIKKIVRPRTSPLFTKYNFNGEDKYVWTTFSDDQIDVNLTNPKMLRYIFDSLFHYMQRGARLFRIDAVPFMWKEIGTSCSHLPKTHMFIQMIRAVFDELPANFILVTESNVPHHENITYWGNANNEAHLIYNFSLSPLLIYSLEKSNSMVLSEWAEKVFKDSSRCGFLNFTATHDGIGLRGLEGLVDDEEVEELCKMAISRGGQVGKKRSRDGAIRPYELNITWASMLNDENLPADLNHRKLVNSQAVILFLPGLSSQYFHNFLGTLNWQEGFEQSGIARRLNRKKMPWDDLKTGENPVLKDILAWLDFKAKHPQFAMDADFSVMDSDPRVFAFVREKNGRKATCFFNLSRNEVPVKMKGLSFVLEGFELKIIS